MATTSSTKDATAFDVSKYTVSNNTRVETVTIEETGDTFEVTINPLSWARRNQFLSDAVTWTTDGTTGVWLGGKSNQGNATNVISKVTIGTPGNATDFGDMLGNIRDNGTASGAAS